MQRITPDRSWPLFDTAASRAVESAAAANLPPHTLMQRAGLGVAKLALALVPRAQTIWVACGPGNNGGDGFEAAMHLKQWGKQVTVTWAGDESKARISAFICFCLNRGNNGWLERAAKSWRKPLYSRHYQQNTRIRRPVTCH